jgi:hypothetical protein
MSDTEVLEWEFLHPAGDGRHLMKVPVSVDRTFGHNAR